MTFDYSQRSARAEEENRMERHKEIMRLAIIRAHWLEVKNFIDWPASVGRLLLSLVGLGGWF